MAESSAEIHDFVRLIHGAGRRVVLAVTGGGGQAVADLLAVPGASQSVLEALVPYSEPALVRFLGGLPDQFCSEATARAMAMAGYHRSGQYAPDQLRRVGVACTASLATDRPKRGAHRIHAAWQTERATATLSVELVKGARSRQIEEQLAGRLVLNMLAEACDLTERLALDLLPDEPVERHQKQAPQSWQDLLAGRLDRVGLSTRPADADRSEIIFAGAFNPRHDGHRQMAAIAERQLGQTPAYEISIANVDKPPLDFLEIDRRVSQFGADEPVWLTRAPTFVEKARLFPRATFIVGADTLRRIADPKYYGGPALMAAALEEIHRHGCAFLVFGRQVAGKFLTLADLELPPVLVAMSTALDEKTFRSDISSSALRKQDDGRG